MNPFKTAVLIGMIGADLSAQTAIEDNKRRIAAEKERIVTTLQTYAREALAEKAVTGGRDERRKLAEAIVAETPKNEFGLTDLPKLRSVFDAVAIRPPYMESFRYLVLYHSGPFDTSAKEEVAALLEGLYRAHSHGGGGSAPGVEWREGHAEILLAMGRSAEAREQIRSAMAEYGDTARVYTRVLAAIIERMNGDPDPFRLIVGDCPPDDTNRGERYCWVVARSIASRAVDVALARDLEPFIE
ncbi:MAG TPA: hypothetical protein VHL59_19690, partial [Thermoanaerobaculia bacterium]|nr:hypothetical protein [Thermoanaerobaculia bacterium]